MTRQAAGAPPIDGATGPVKVMKPTSVEKDGVLRLKNFTGEIILTPMPKLRTLATVHHQDNHKPYFDPIENGWQVS